jgi:hypothetical protein
MRFFLSERSTPVSLRIASRRYSTNYTRTLNPGFATRRFAALLDQLHENAQAALRGAALLNQVQKSGSDMRRMPNPRL